MLGMYVWFAVMSLLSGGCCLRNVGAWHSANRRVRGSECQSTASFNSTQACFAGRGGVCCWLACVICVSGVRFVMWFQLLHSGALARVVPKQQGSDGHSTGAVGVLVRGAWVSACMQGARQDTLVSWFAVMSLVSGGCRFGCVGAWCWADDW